MKELSDVDWVRLAASRDMSRPILAALSANDKRIVATDGHRAHIVTSPCGMAPGIWGLDCRPVSGNYPNVETVTPIGAPTLAVKDLTGMWAITAAAIAAGKVLGPELAVVTLPSRAGFIALHPPYFLDILKGAGKARLAIYTQGSLKPIRVETLGNPQRIAVLMPIRVRNQEVTSADPRFDLSEFVEIIEAEQSA